MPKSIHERLEDTRQQLEPALHTLERVVDQIHVEMIAVNASDDSVEVRVPLRFFHQLTHDMRSCYDELRILLALADELGLDDHN